MCMLASYQKDAMLNGERKALNDSSFVAFTVNEKTTHTHRRVYRYVRY